MEEQKKSKKGKVIIIAVAVVVVLAAFYCWFSGLVGGINEVEAKEIIVEKLGGSESIEDMYIVSEFDDFIKVYDASVICDDGMYEFEILARNGKLLSFEYSGQELPNYVNQDNGLHLKD